MILSDLVQRDGAEAVIDRLNNVIRGRWMRAGAISPDVLYAYTMAKECDIEATDYCPRLERWRPHDSNPVNVFINLITTIRSLSPEEALYAYNKLPDPKPCLAEVMRHAIQQVAGVVNMPAIERRADYAMLASMLKEAFPDYTPLRARGDSLRTLNDNANILLLNMMGVVEHHSLACEFAMMVTMEKLVSTHGL